RAAQLKAAAALQALRLDPEPPPLPIERKQRRSDDMIGDTLRRSEDTFRRRSSILHTNLGKSEGKHKSLHGGPTTIYRQPQPHGGLPNRKAALSSTTSLEVP